MSCSVLNEPCFVTESVVTIFSHAMKMSLVLSVIATSESAVFIEPEKLLKMFKLINHI